MDTELYDKSFQMYSDDALCDVAPKLLQPSFLWRSAARKHAQICRLLGRLSALPTCSAKLCQNGYGMSNALALQITSMRAHEATATTRVRKVLYTFPLLAHTVRDTRKHEMFPRTNAPLTLFECANGV